MITSAWHILAIVLAVGFAFMFYHIIKLIIQLKDTVATLEKTIKNLENEVAPIISNLDGITGKFEDITERADSIIVSVQDKTGETGEVIEKLKINLDVTKHSFYLILTQSVKYFKALGIGLKVGVKHFTSDSKDQKSVMNNTKEVSKIRIVDHLEKSKYH